MIVTVVRLDFRRLLVLNNAYALLADIVVHRQLVKSAITDSIKMNQAKVHARFVLLDSILTTTAISFMNMTKQVTVYHAPPDNTL